MSPLKVALCTLVRKANFDAIGYERLAVVPFESDNKFMATLNRLPEGDGNRIFMNLKDQLNHAARVSTGLF